MLRGSSLPGFILFYCSGVSAEVKPLTCIQVTNVTPPTWFFLPARLFARRGWHIKLFPPVPSWHDWVYQILFSVGKRAGRAWRAVKTEWYRGLDRESRQETLRGPEQTSFTCIHTKGFEWSSLMIPDPLWEIQLRISFVQIFFVCLFCNL